ncbi:MAG: RNase J family beta-CASP ribonuclease, partial [Clostridiales bacterium]|nr:RNase J family beta-CASP ribonuclease [Clostridiales bacterium]
MAKQNNTGERGAGGKRNSTVRKYTYRKVSSNPRPQADSRVKAVKIAFLGGMNEIGKNLTLFEYGNDMFILDCGLAFPDPQLLGVD